MVSVSFILFNLRRHHKTSYGQRRKRSYRYPVEFLSLFTIVTFIPDSKKRTLGFHKSPTQFLAGGRIRRSADDKGHDSRTTKCKSQDKVADVVLSALIVSVHHMCGGAAQRHVFLGLSEGDHFELFPWSVTRKRGFNFCKNTKAI